MLLSSSYQESVIAYFLLLLFLLSSRSSITSTQLCRCKRPLNCTLTIWVGCSSKESWERCSSGFISGCRLLLFICPRGWGASKLCWVTTGCSCRTMTKQGHCCRSSITDHIMPRTPGILSYEETKEVLEDMLGDKISVFRRRIDVMRLAIGNLTFRKLRSTINRMVALDQFDSLTKENFKCLIYISALQGTKYADIRTRLLSKLEKQEGCALADLVNESESIIGLKKDLVNDTTHQRGNQRKKNRQDLPSKSSQELQLKEPASFVGPCSTRRRIVHRTTATTKEVQQAHCLSWASPKMSQWWGYEFQSFIWQQYYWGI